MAEPQGTWRAYAERLNRADLDGAEALARSPGLGRIALGIVHAVRGDFAAARADLAAPGRPADPAARRALATAAGIDPYLLAAAQMAPVLFCLGHPDEARDRAAAALAEADGLAHMPTLAACAAGLARLSSLCGDERGTAAAAARLAAAAEEDDLPQARAQVRVFLGRAAAGGGDGKGRLILRAGIAAYAASGAAVMLPFFWALDAEAAALAGRRDEALALLQRALRRARQTGERWFEAELLRRLGVLLEERDPPTGATMFREAGRVAQRQSAAFWELRAATNLARRLVADGRQGEAREVLLPVYRQFGEGFDLIDLAAAAALARELG